MTVPSDQDELQHLGHTKVEQERAAFRSSLDDDDFLLDCCTSGEAGDARLFIKLYHGRLCYDHAAGQWHRWAGHFWALCELDEPLAECEVLVQDYGQLGKRWAWRKMTAAKAGSTDEIERAKGIEGLILRKIASLQRRHYRQEVLILAAAGEDSLGVTGKGWDNKPHLIGFRNGVFDLEQKKFRPGRPEDQVRTIIPWDWAASDAPRPRWEKFIDEILVDPEMVSYMKRLLGSAMSGKVLENVLPILWGESGRNGKTCLLEVLGHVLGPLAGPIQGELLLAQKYPRSSAAPSPDIMGLRGKRLVWASETDEGRKLNCGKVKWLTGGDSLTGRNPHDRREVTFIPTHTLLMLTNFAPIVNPDDAALWERLHLVEFKISFVDEPIGENQKKRNPNLADELKEEAPGIMAWLIDGYYLYLKEGLAPPPPVLCSTREYRRSEDFYLRFLDDCCLVQEGLFCRGGDIFEKYKAWCADSGLRPQRKKFYKKLTTQFDSFKTESGKLYSGIGLLMADGT